MEFIECENHNITMDSKSNREDVEPNIPKSGNQEIDQSPAIFPCISCYMTFLDREECREHMREHARNMTLKCRYCNEFQEGMKQLLHHLKKHRAESSRCVAAGSLQPASINNAKSHPKGNKQTPEMKSSSETLEVVEDGTETLDAIPDVTEPKRSRGRKKGSYVYNRTCTECGEVFSSTTTLKNHKKLHNAGKLLYSCCYCEYRSDFPAAIGKHLKKKHENLKMLFKCALCKYVAIRISLLKTHVTLNKHYYT